MRPWTTAAALALATVTTGSVLAQRADWEPDTHRAGAGAEIYVWYASDFLFGADFGTSVPVVGFVNIEATDDFFIDVYLPFASAVGGDDTRVGLGNPTATFRYAPTHGVARWWLGGGISASMGAMDDRRWRDALSGAGVATALYDSHLWVVDAIPLHATGGVDIRVVDFMSLQAEAKVIPWLPIEDRRRVELVLQNRLGVEFRHPTVGFGGGIHGKVVYIPTIEGGVFPVDRAQTALEPHFAYTHEFFFLRLGVVHALDAPLGILDDGGIDVISGHLTLGGSWN